MKKTSEIQELNSQITKLNTEFNQFENAKDNEEIAKMR